MASFNIFHWLTLVVIFSLQIRYAHGVCADPKQAPWPSNNAPGGFTILYEEVWSYCKDSEARNAVIDFLFRLGKDKMTLLSSYCKKAQIALAYVHECQFIDAALMKVQTQLPIRKHSPPGFLSLFNKLKQTPDVGDHEASFQALINDLINQVKASGVITLKYYCNEQETKQAPEVCAVIDSAFHKIVDPIKMESTADELSQSLGCDGVFKSKIMCDSIHLDGIRKDLPLFCFVVDVAFRLEFRQIADYEK